MSGSKAAATDAPSIGWMLGMSSWMLLTVVPGPTLTWLGFSIIGVASRSRRLIILGVVWGAAAILASLELWGQWQPLVRAIVYLAGMLVALMVNPGWLRAMWQRRTERGGGTTTASRTRETTWHRAAATTSATTTKAPSRPSRSARRKAAAAARAAEAKRARGATAAAGKTKTTDAAAPSSSKSPTGEAAELASAVGYSTDDLLAADLTPEPIDVNTAGASELEKLPGMTRSRARRAVKEREAQGGFTSVEDFGESVGLQPHEIVRLRRLATCSPRPRGARRFGRRVDY
ncbi:ComEA family DNA-binding protein [Microbacterium timonense]|uniref:ComEA family DNA-binding protein n=1 Tax=Microbacterium timonense TaxID=2086576 RepID=UPI000D0E9535|nr:helix-hairpin-helix domain-containing protein [Microbacterium timonense]